MVKELIFVDTSFIIGLINTKDQWHNKAMKIAQKIEKEKKVVSNVIIIEVLNGLGKFDEGRLGEKIYRVIKDNFVIYEENRQIYDAALKTHLKYKGKIGYADCIIIEVMKDLEINNIISFDSHFDGKEGIVKKF
jgi:predicted nucleic acid-binding protein